MTCSSQMFFLIDDNYISMAKKNKRNVISFFNSHLISVVSISLVLYLLGLIFIMGFLGNDLSQLVKENIAVSVILTEELTDKDIRKMRDEFERLPYVKSTEYISKEQASLEMQRELGEDPEKFLGFNPFNASIEVKLKSDYVHPDSLMMINKNLLLNQGISKIQYQQDLLQVLNQNLRHIGVILFLLLIILMVISFVLINNTVRLLIYSKRFIIYTMRLVGATSGFIRRPFLWNNFISGCIAAFIAIFMLVGSLYYVQLSIPGIEEILQREKLMVVYGIVIVAGIMLSMVAAYFAVSKYLRMARGKLYYV